MNGKELVFKRPGEDSDGEDDGVADGPAEPLTSTGRSPSPVVVEQPAVVDVQRIIIHEDD